MRSRKLIGRTALALAATWLTMFTSAHAATFGRTTVGSIPSSSMKVDYKRGSKFTLNEAGVLSQLCAYVDGNGGAGDIEQLTPVVYRDDHGVPGDLVYQALNPIAIFQGEAPNWQCSSTADLPLAPGDYWLVILSAGVPNVARYFYDGPADWYGAPDVAADGASRVFGPGVAGSGTISIHALYRPGTIRTLGRLTMAATPSSPITANFKRGSSFVLTEPGQIGHVNVYLDGMGGASGAEWVRVAIYKDDNGVPGERVGDGGEIPIWAGMPPTWRTFYVASDGLSPGRYWLVLHTGGTSGVARYYLDGTGNWYGNADTYADGASAVFGAGAPGNGTLSAFAVYETGTFTRRQFGRTNVATRPSKGLTADYTRGAHYGLREDDPQGVATALYAYMDGRGGASGSQQVRMVMYIRDAESDIGYWMIPSDVVTIQAGAPARWVRFPIPFTYLIPGSYWLMIQSGQNAGVARYYIDGEASNWSGANDGFADGPEDYYQPELYGAGTISAYIDFTEFHAQ